MKRVWPFTNSKISSNSAHSMVKPCSVVLRLMAVFSVENKVQSTVRVV